ncbi:hypothetical protein Ciccas_004424, partial [Cichlidogyrus casuarinus]
MFCIKNDDSVEEEAKQGVAASVMTAVAESGEEELSEVLAWLVELGDPCEDMETAFLKFESLSNYSGGEALPWARFLALCCLNRMPRVVVKVREVAEKMFQLLTSVSNLRRQQSHLAQSTPPPPSTTLNSEVSTTSSSSRRSSRSNQGNSANSISGRRSHHRQRNQASQAQMTGPTRFNQNGATYSGSNLGLNASAMLALEQKIDIRLQLIHAICNLHSSW